jgi:hypothetical protein
MQPPRHRLAEQMVPGGVEDHFVDAMTVAIVGMETGRIGIGVASPLEGGSASRQGSHRLHLRLRPAGALTANTLYKRSVLSERIIIDQWSRLVEDVVCRVSRRVAGRARGDIPSI